jgi:hypothetical protein
VAHLDGPRTSARENEERLSSVGGAAEKTRRASSGFFGARRSGSQGGADCRTRNRAITQRGRSSVGDAKSERDQEQVRLIRRPVAEKVPRESRRPLAMGFVAGRGDARKVGPGARAGPRSRLRGPEKQ